jgi:hypothetical protein
MKNMIPRIPLPSADKVPTREVDEHQGNRSQIHFHTFYLRYFLTSLVSYFALLKEQMAVEFLDSV